MNSVESEGAAKEASDISAVSNLRENRRQQRETPAPQLTATVTPVGRKAVCDLTRIEEQVLLRIAHVGDAVRQARSAVDALLADPLRARVCVRREIVAMSVTHLHYLHRPAPRPSWSEAFWPNESARRRKTHFDLDRARCPGSSSGPRSGGGLGGGFGTLCCRLDHVHERGRRGSSLFCWSSGGNCEGRQGKSEPAADRHTNTPPSDSKREPEKRCMHTQRTPADSPWSDRASKAGSPSPEEAKVALTETPSVATSAPAPARASTTVAAEEYKSVEKRIVRIGGKSDERERVEREEDDQRLEIGNKGRGTSGDTSNSSRVRR